MITHIDIEGFKSLKKLSLDLGGLNIFIGTNASGKSNFFEALRVLQGIGYGFSIDEIFNGKPKGAGNEVWEPIRGGSDLASFRWPSSQDLSLLHFTVKVEAPDLDQLTYSIVINPFSTRIEGESLYLGDAPIFENNTSTHTETPELAEHDVPLTKTCRSLLANTQVLDPAAANLRDYSKMHSANRMGDRGENFAGLVNSILRQGATAEAYTSWLKELTPAELDEVVPMRGAVNDTLFAVRRGSQIIPGPILSDGTLRFAAIAAAFFQPDMPNTLLIEEIETGLHPTRLRLLLELLKSQSASGKPQVMATSHSPQVLAWLTEEDYKTTFLCRKDEETGASTITPLSEVPGFLELARKQPAADLFAEGWLEGAL